MTTEIPMYPGYSRHSEEPENSEHSNVVKLPTPPNQRITPSVERIVEKHRSGNLNSLFAVTIDGERNVDIIWGDKGTDVKTIMLVASCLDMLRQNLINSASKDVLGG